MKATFSHSRITKVCTASVLLLITFLASSCNKSVPLKKTCDLSPAQMPEVLGFKIGGKLEDIKSRFPELEFPQGDPFLQVTLRSLSGTEFDKDASKVVIFDPSKHPELVGVEQIGLNIDKNSVFLVGITYSPRREWTQISGFQEFINRELNFPYEATSFPEKPDKDEKTSSNNMVTCLPADKSAGTSDLTLSFREQNGKRFPSISIIERDRFLSFIDHLSNGSYNTKALKNPSEIKTEPSIPPTANIIVIAGVKVEVGQDASISQDRLEQHLVKTVGNTDTYSYLGKTYEITYGPGERGAYFVRSIKVY